MDESILHASHSIVTIVVMRAIGCKYRTISNLVANHRSRYLFEIPH